MSKTILVIILIILLVITCISSLLIFEKDKVVYINNAEIFQNFSGTKLLNQRIKNIRAKHLSKIDSISAIDAYTVNDINKIKLEYERKEKELVDRYSSDIWKTLNHSIEKFAMEKRIDIVLGANGSGTLMYADSSKNVTDEVIQYVNNNYEGNN